MSYADWQNAKLAAVVQAGQIELEEDSEDMSHRIWLRQPVASAALARVSPRGAERKCGQGAHEVFLLVDATGAAGSTAR